MPLALKHGLQFDDLYRRDGLARIDTLFVAHLAAGDVELYNRLMSARRDPGTLEANAESELIIDLAPHLEDFIGDLFAIAPEIAALQARHHELAPLYTVKRLFVQRRAVKGVTAGQAAALDGPALAAALEARFGESLTELAFATHVAGWMEAEDANKEALDLAAFYAAWATLSPAGREKHRRGVLFKVPHRLVMEHLVPVESESVDGVTMLRLPRAAWRHREGFGLTDPGTDLTGALDQANYCIWCHTQGKDSCSKGLKDKPPADAPQKIAFKKSPFGVTLAGCPLEEKISEFHTLKSQGNALSALAVLVIATPMVAVTGHRICNDCVKSCIYQKQEPVNIPQAETRTLKDVLELPWGFEIYSLLTRWNPLNFRRPLPLPATGRKVLIAGMGPAGFTLAHYLMNDGHAVVGIDGLKIEPLPEQFSGIKADGTRTKFEPIRDVKTLYESLDDRVMAGFGGVAEYGITVRWDKNFLKLVRLLLERRAQFALFGG